MVVTMQRHPCIGQGGTEGDLQGRLDGVSYTEDVINNRFLYPGTICFEDEDRSAPSLQSPMPDWFYTASLMPISSCPPPIITLVSNFHLIHTVCVDEVEGNCCTSTYCCRYRNLSCRGTRAAVPISQYLPHCTAAGTATCRAEVQEPLPQCLPHCTAAGTVTCTCRGTRAAVPTSSTLYCCRYRDLYVQRYKSRCPDVVAYAAYTCFRQARGGAAGRGR